MGSLQSIIAKVSVEKKSLVSGSRVILKPILQIRMPNMNFRSQTFSSEQILAHLLAVTFYAFHLVPNKQTSSTQYTD